MTNHPAAASAPSLEHTACNLCGSEATELLRNARVLHYGQAMEFAIVRCRSCRLVYIDPRPDPEYLGAFYPKGYQEDILRFLEEGRKSPIFRLGMRMLRKRRIPPVAGGGQLLDIGCSNGMYLAAAREAGWKVRGIELDEAAAEVARTHFGLDVDCGDGTSLLRSYPEASLDVVTLWHVLEHFADPLGILREIFRVLRPGGKILMEVPNFASPLAGLLGDHWFPLDPPRHLYHFTPATLEAMLRKAGFEGIRVRGVPSPEAIVWSLASLGRSGPEESVPGQPLKANLPAMAAAFPVSWMMALFNRSDHMSVAAEKTPRLS